jgi:thiol-disulfide isomerase/thioredoxin
MRRDYLFVIAIVALGALIWALLDGKGQTKNRGSEHSAVGKAFPQIQWQPLVGAQAPLRSSDLRGKVLLVNYFGTWCPPCYLEFPQLSRLVARNVGHPDFRAVLVSCSQSEMEEETLKRETEQFLKRFNVSLPVYSDRQFCGSLSLPSSTGFPKTGLVDRTGIVRGLWIGYEPGWDKEVESLLQDLLNN